MTAGAVKYAAREFDSQAAAFFLTGFSIVLILKMEGLHLPNFFEKEKIDMPDLSVEIAGIKMQNPVMNAAGTFDIESEAARALTPVEKMGAYVQKTVTFKERAGNPQPRVTETPSGMINTIGLQNVGRLRFVEEKLAIIFGLLPSHVPLVVSIAGESIEEYLEIAMIMEEKSEGRITALEINVSCPNVRDGLIFGCSHDLLFKLVRGVKSKVTTLPSIVKLTPNVTDIGSLARVVVDAGADAISLVNTFKGRDFIKRGPGAGQWIVGGLSGPAIRPLALQKVAEVMEVVKVPVIGMGGIANFEDALDFFRLGVTAVAVGTANFANPLAMAEIVKGLEQYLTEKDCSSIADLKEKKGGFV